MLTPDEAAETATTLWRKGVDERANLARLDDYARGARGKPDLPDGANDEIKDLATMSVKNIMPLVIDAFSSALSVVGFRSPDAETDDVAWAMWQAQRMDARQSEVYSAALKFGASYVIVGTSDASGQTAATFQPRSPQATLAYYDDPGLDVWPLYAVDTWLDLSGPKPVVRGRFYDAEASYPIVMKGTGKGAQCLVDEGEPTAHGFSVCPIVRFVNGRGEAGAVVGEISPLLLEQQALNATNFDRLVVSRFGAFPQKWVIGWDAQAADVARAAASRLMAWADDTVKVGSFAAADVGQYNALLREMEMDIAVKAQIPVAGIVGNIANLSAEAIAMTEAPYQRKLAAKRESFGESWEQMLRLAATVERVEVDDSAEVIWRDTEPRSFAQVVDGLAKLDAAGVPISELLDMIPGMTKQRADSIRARLERGDAQRMVEAILAAPEPAASAAV